MTASLSSACSGDVAQTDPVEPPATLRDVDLQIIDDGVSGEHAEVADPVVMELTDIVGWPVSPVLEVINDDNDEVQHLLEEAFNGEMDTELATDEGTEIYEWVAVVLNIMDSTNETAPYQAYAEFVDWETGADIGAISAVIAEGMPGKLADFYLLEPGMRGGKRMVYFVGFVERDVPSSRRAIGFTVYLSESSSAAAVLPLDID